jgi:hypothetical protein
MRGAIAMQVADLAAPQAHCELAATTLARGYAGPGRYDVDDLLAGAALSAARGDGVLVRGC